MERVMGLAPTT